jgi:hypothetical protein
VIDFAASAIIRSFVTRMAAIALRSTVRAGWCGPRRRISSGSFAKVAGTVWVPGEVLTIEDAAQAVAQ